MSPAEHAKWEATARALMAECERFLNRWNDAPALAERLRRALEST